MRYRHIDDPHTDRQNYLKMSSRSRIDRRTPATQRGKGCTHSDVGHGQWALWSRPRGSVFAPCGRRTRPFAVDVVAIVDRRDATPVRARGLVRGIWKRDDGCVGGNAQCDLVARSREEANVVERVVGVAVSARVWLWCWRRFLVRGLAIAVALAAPAPVVAG